MRDVAGQKMAIVSNVQHWRSRVEETLLVARSLKHEEARRVTLELALVYGRLAELAERRQAQQARSADAAAKPASPPKPRVAPPPFAVFAPQSRGSANATPANDPTGTAKKPAMSLGAP